MESKDDLSLIGTKPEERRKLESMGFISLEQMVLLDYISLGMSKARGDALVRSARNIIANKHIQEISVGQNRITIILDKLNDAIRESVLGVLEAVEGDNGNCIVTLNGNNLNIFTGNNPYFSFDTVIKNAKTWEMLLESKRKIDLRKKGITINEKEIMEFAKERGFKGFYENVFGEIKGNDIIKKALTVSLFSSFEEPVHTLIVGDPGSSKTLAKEIIIKNFKDVVPVGANSTKAGLICNMTTGTLGVLAYSDKQTVLIDEFDKIPDTDIEYCYELLSNGKCSVHSARIHQNIESNFIMVAFANPKYGTFKGRPIDEINLPSTLLSRFAFAIRTEILKQDDRHELFKKKFFGGSEVRTLPEHYNEWINYSRLHEPQIKVSDKKIDEYIRIVNEEIVEKYYGTNLRRDLRMGDYIRRIPISIARAEFSDVTDKTLDLSLSLIQESIETWKWV